MSITKVVLNETKNFSAKRSLCDRTLQFDNLYLVSFKHTHRKILLKSTNKEAIKDTKKSLWDRLLQFNIMY